MISYILVNYNTKKITYQTIQSIINTQSQCYYEIILVDNGSTDGSKEFFENLIGTLENFKYIYNNKNLGFSKANNIGFNYSKGNYIYILNSDTILNTENINIIVKEKFKKYNNIGLLATKVNYSDGTPQPNVQAFSNLYTIVFRLLKIGQFIRNKKLLLKLFKLLPYKLSIVEIYLKNFNKINKDDFIDWASGCSLIFRREIYEKLGGFDENFFMYTEDEEICYRIHQFGYKILYTPDIAIAHFAGKSNINKEINEFILKEQIKSEFFYYKKHFPEKIKKLKIIYNIITYLGSPFSSRLKLIRKKYIELINEKNIIFI